MRGYVIKRGNEYLVGMNISKTANNFSIYRYDAIQIENLEMAQRIIRRLRKPGEEWHITYLDRLTGNERMVTR